MLDSTPVTRAITRIAGTPRRRVINQPFQAELVEGMHPITQCLPIHAPNASRCLPAHAVTDRSQSQQSTRLLLTAAACRSSLALIPSLSGTATMPRLPESV